MLSKPVINIFAQQQSFHKNFTQLTTATAHQATIT